MINECFEAFSKHFTQDSLKLMTFIWYFFNIKNYRQINTINFEIGMFCNILIIVCIGDVRNQTRGVGYYAKTLAAVLK